MDIKTITCQNVYNYGASLQAYALQTYLEQLGHKVEIINFNPWYLCTRYNPFFIHPASRFYQLVQRIPFLKYALGQLANRHMFRVYGRKGRFDKFTSDYLWLTKLSYKTSEELQKNPPKADIYIAGSDQIWNTDMQNGHEPAFYADFGSKETLRVAYAASFGIENLPEEYREFVHDEVVKFNAISVREQSGLKILKELGINNAVQVVDPVFLLEKDEWGQLTIKAHEYKNVPKSKYILIYDFIQDERIAKMATELKRQTNFPIVSVNDFRETKYADYNINDAGPLEFINLISNSAYVLANSFHGTVFAIIFNKQFYSFSLESQRTSSRMRDLLSQYGLECRFNAQQIIDDDIDYKKVNGIKEKLVKDSEKWLGSVLKGGNK